MKKNYLAALTLALAGLIPALVHAQAMGLRADNGWDIGIDLSTYDYQQSGGQSFTLEGRKIGIAVSMTEALSNHWYARGEFRYSPGTLYMDSNSAAVGTKGNNKHQTMDMRILGGRDFAGLGQVLSPFFGFGYRLVYDDLTGMTTGGLYGTRRDERMSYIPIGISHRFLLGGSARLNTTVEYDFLFLGTGKIYTIDNHAPPSTNAIVSQRNGHGLRGSVAYEAPTWSLTLFLNYWYIDDSDPGSFSDAGTPTSIVLPVNITKEIGAQLKFRF